MSRLSISYREDDPQNSLGDMYLTVEAGGMVARGLFYVRGPSLLTFAAKLKAFPIPSEGIEEEYPGEFAIWVKPEGSFGHLLVTTYVSVASFTDGFHKQEATLMFTADYSSIDAFARALLRTFNGDGSEAILIGIGE